MGAYRDELLKAMTYLSGLENSIFIGQAVARPGTAMYGTLDNVPLEKRIELPVEEDFQMGLGIGLAMHGLLPICIFPRWNFLILAANQLVNHVDKLGEMMQEIPPKIIVRTSIGSKRPLHPGPQHTGDYTSPFAQMAPSIDFVRLDEPDEIFPAYRHAATRDDGISTVLVEWGDFYSEK